jgi:hypothetical protein
VARISESRGKDDTMKRPKKKLGLKPVKKVYSNATFESAAIDILEAKKEPLRASNINSEIVTQYKVSQIRATPKRLARLLRRNPKIRATKSSRGYLYELF